MKFFRKIDLNKPRKLKSEDECLTNGSIRPLENCIEELENRNPTLKEGKENAAYEKEEKETKEKQNVKETVPAGGSSVKEESKIQAEGQGKEREEKVPDILSQNLNLERKRIEEKKVSSVYKEVSTCPSSGVIKSPRSDVSHREKDSSPVLTLEPSNHPKDVATTLRPVAKKTKEHVEESQRRHSRWHKLHGQISKCLDHPNLIHWTTLVFITLATWGIIYSIAGAQFLPGSQLFSLLVLFILAFIGGELVKVIKLPPLLGMLLVGLLLRNVGFINLKGVYTEVTATLREIALCIILIRAGLGLDPKALKSLKFVILRLALLPGIVEATITTVVTHFLLGLPWLWGLLMGAILAAVSPAVVIPCLFSLQERGYGTGKGIPTLVVAAASLDDIFAITVFGVVLDVIYSTGESLTFQIIQGPVGVLVGIIFGIVWGFIAHFVPHQKDSQVVLLRVLMIVGGGLVAIVGSGAIGYQGAGPLGCIIAAFVACLGWRRQDYTEEHNPVANVFRIIWLIFQPILFGLIGSEVDVFVLEASTIGNGVIALFCSLLGRIVISVFIGYGAGFNWKEKTFIAWAWFPKATVQAALGPLALDIARRSGSQEEINYAKKILILAVLAILITAPLGSILITTLGPRLLAKGGRNTSQKEKTKEEVNLESRNDDSTGNQK